jgi:hypothetical protein
VLSIKSMGVSSVQLPHAALQVYQHIVTMAGMQQQPHCSDELVPICDACATGHVPLHH